MPDEHPAALTASEAARRIREGLLSSEERVGGCLERLRQVEPEVRAWQFLDEKHALDEARAADQRKAEGEPIGPLHGLAAVLHDINDTAEMPTESGTVLCT